ncbi:MAG: hypothetical protein A2X34_04630 [Elusimicrobia bacterium GWC2_51_8]|nr:MAG: hypothetical protein A2X33_00405 [Elusimicrobia bacterium GWA2_51_34]OGR63648.1 MAG: hypothetical protein A2X34_04630 [Elusimicrobia bacterium GWC2_51_8]OGR84584.1 MAG: hypothetical protein A2021_02510 [Elusimicrobia bacterium GWF2_52_66]HAF96331.1 hypothetical protein [Elusimicrobiota bacterium]HCE98517.1 hypothetical protein [Elusimicrobiota bacterium]
MGPENKIKIAKETPFAAAIVGIPATAGWIFDIGSLKSVSPARVSMKFPDAAFVLSGFLCP